MGHPDEHLTGYVDGTLSQADAAGVAAHLAECEACRETVADLLAVRRLLGSASAPGPHPSLLPRTLARLPQARRRHALVPRLAAATAVGVLLFLALQLRVLPSHMGMQMRTWFFRSHAQAAAAHPMEDVAVAAYLSTPLPYETDLGPEGMR